jgi:hypothetical protein
MQQIGEGDRILRSAISAASMRPVDRSVKLTFRWSINEVPDTRYNSTQAPRQAERGCDRRLLLHIMDKVITATPKRPLQWTHVT